MHVFRRSFFNSPSHMRRSNEEHRAIFEAIVKSDTRRAKTLAERHVQSGRTRLLAKLER
jgi:DNA-binding GntR family transcriptional regulator